MLQLRQGVHPNDRRLYLENRATVLPPLRQSEIEKIVNSLKIHLTHVGNSKEITKFANEL